MVRKAEVRRKTTETDICISLALDPLFEADIKTGIGFFDHMLTLFAHHGRFGLSLKVSGDLHVDSHHTVEDTGLVLGQALSEALGDRAGITRYGHFTLPMDDTLSAVTIDLSNRPYLVLNADKSLPEPPEFDFSLATEFFRSFCVKGGMNLHINVFYGQNGHHIMESVFKALGRALKMAVTIDPSLTGVPSTKGAL